MSNKNTEETVIKTKDKPEKQIYLGHTDILNDNEKIIKQTSDYNPLNVGILLGRTFWVGGLTLGPLLFVQINAQGGNYKRKTMSGLLSYFIFNTSP